MFRVTRKVSTWMCRLFNKVLSGSSAQVWRKYFAWKHCMRRTQVTFLFWGFIVSDSNKHFSAFLLIVDQHTWSAKQGRFCLKWNDETIVACLLQHLNLCDGSPQFWSFEELFVLSAAVFSWFQQHWPEKRKPQLLVYTFTERRGPNLVSPPNKDSTYLYLTNNVPFPCAWEPRRDEDKYLQCCGTHFLQKKRRTFALSVRQSGFTWSTFAVWLLLNLMLFFARMLHTKESRSCRSKKWLHSYPRSISHRGVKK